MIRALILAAAVTLAMTASADPQARPGSEEVDLQLVLAVDISYSMDPEEQRLQRDGYLQAIVAPEVMDAIKRGLIGKIAVTYLEWAGAFDQQVVVGWRIIDGPASAQAFAAELQSKPIRRAFRTSISGAINASAALFDTSGLRSQRRVIDVSGDGANNNGPLVEPARDAALSRGITINGLPIMLKRPDARTMDLDNLDAYYHDCVIGGPGAFVIPIKDPDEFVPATRRKLILEVAGLPPQWILPTGATIAPAQSERIDCLIGERMWRERWDRN
ncbi:DUF1194 domain-containing protein [Phreatobacter stygius]|uniref:DUF1194 domain-containing protein n=1 Tax=Phreatobacter stygius TaxID=1940610 RepID=A0A4D7B0D2_9HYPH|nr:DUF1194 domain-containing protein [Phreatobacter stygius]QCI66171.1 DUF1194 domain-containing protein [Phreatobacter stygius]